MNKNVLGLLSWYGLKFLRRVHPEMTHLSDIAVALDLIPGISTRFIPRVFAARRLRIFFHVPWSGTPASLFPEGRELG